MVTNIQFNDTIIQNALLKVKPGLHKYQFIRNMIYNVDVSESIEFKQAFNGFYRMRQRPKQFYNTFYRFMEKNKYNSPSFEHTLNYINEELGRIEASFSSKLVATINPDLPIWDTVVLNNLGKKAPPYYKKNRINEIISIYDEILTWYDLFLRTEEAHRMIQLFEIMYPNTGLTNTKKVDFVLWQIRE